MRPVAGYGDNCVSHWELKNKNNISGEEKSSQYLVVTNDLTFSGCPGVRNCTFTRCRKLGFCLNILFSVNQCQCPFLLLMVPCRKYCTSMWHISLPESGRSRLWGAAGKFTFSGKRWIQRKTMSHEDGKPAKHLDPNVPRSTATVLSHAEDTWPKVEAKPAVELISAFPRALDCSLQG